MTTKAKKLFSVCLVLLMLLTSAPLSGFTDLELPNFSSLASAANTATSGQFGDNAYWSFDESTGTLSITGSGEMKHYSWGNAPWYAHHAAIKSVNISGITGIGNEAFYDCESLESITIPNSVTNIGKDIVNDYVHITCNKNSAAEKYAKANGNPYGLIDGTTGENTFSGRYGSMSWSIDRLNMVLSIECDGAMPTISSYSGAPWYKYKYYIKSVNLPDTLTKISNYAFYCCSHLSSITIPGSVTSIGDEAFYNCNSLTSITIPGSVTGIGKYAFYYCTGLSSITIPDSVTGIGEYAFSGCDSLASVTIPNSVKSIGDGAFSSCDSLTSITIPDSVTIIGNSMFSGCDNLTSITIPDSVTSIGEYAFEDCYRLASITIPNSVTSIDNSAFNGCTNITSFNVDANNQCYSNDVNGVLFNKQKTRLIRYPYGKKDSVYTVPASVTSIGDRAFSDCTSLASIAIQNGVTVIGDSAFAYCTSLSSVTIPNSVTGISNSAFQGCTNLSSITIPSGVTSIGDYAFSFCTTLTSITIPDGVTGIGDSAFVYCSSLASVTIPSSVTGIANYAFDGCSNLKDVYYTGSVSQWKNLSVGSDNDYLINAKIHYISEGHEHIYTPKITKPVTCTSAGTKTFFCNCGDSYTETIPATGHKLITLEPKAATCTATGLTAGKKCSVCGKVTVAQSVVPKTAHTGVPVEAFEATCTIAGKTEGTRCRVCGTIISGCETIPAQGHVDEDDDGYCDVCSVQLEKEDNSFIGKLKAFFQRIIDWLRSLFKFG